MPIKTNVMQLTIYFDENQDTDITDTKVKKIIIQLKQLTMNSNIFKKLGFLEGEQRQGIVFNPFLYCFALFRFF